MLSYFPIILIGYSGITSFKTMNFAVITAAAVIGIALFVLRRSGIRSFIGKERFKSLSVSSWFLIGFVFVQIVSTLISPYAWRQNPDGLPTGLFGYGRCEGLLIQLLYAAAFVIISRAGSFALSAVRILTVTMIIMNAVAIIQLFGINFLWFYPSDTMLTEQYFGVFYSTIGNVDILGSFYCIALTFVFGGFVFGKDGRVGWNIAQIIAVVTGVFTVIEINVSAALLAFGVTAVLFLPLFIVKGSAKKTLVLLSASAVFAAFALSFDRVLDADKKQIILSFSFTNTAAAALVAAALLLLLYFIIGRIKRRPSDKAALFAMYITEAVFIIGFFVWLKWFYTVSDGSNDLVRELSSLVRGEINDYSGTHRIAIWKCSFKVFSEYPVFGVGAGAFQPAFADISGEAYKQYSSLSVDMAHNDYLQTACSYGAVGFSALLGFIVSLFCEGIKKAKTDRFAITLLAALFCYAAQAFFSFSIVFVFPICIALAAMLKAECGIDK